MTRQFGQILGVEEGHSFKTRRLLSMSGVHKPTMNGISGSQNEGADSIVLSGGYKDDKDYGDVIVYTGQGGRDSKTGKQIAHQELTDQNRALALSFEKQLPIRVSRGSGHKSVFSPLSGYRYDGLYIIENYWREVGLDGFNIWRYRLVKVDSMPVPRSISSDENELPKRIATVVNNIVRDSAIANFVKDLYDYRCQICNQRIETPLGYYSEAAHIRPLGTPHDGRDSKDNVLCLCPNHHKMLDYHCFSIADDLALIGIPGSLTLHDKHKLDLENIRYHREHFYNLA